MSLINNAEYFQLIWHFEPINNISAFFPRFNYIVFK